MLSENGEERLGSDSCWSGFHNASTTPDFFHLEHLQPVFGAMSDRMRTTSLVCGRRRIFIVVAQLATVGTLAMMAWAPDSGGSVNRRFWLLAWGYVRC